MALKCSSSGFIPIKGWSSNRWFCQVQPHQAHPVKRWTRPILPHSYALTRLIHTWQNQQLIPPWVSSPGSHLHLAELAVDSAMVCPHQARLRLAESVVDSAMPGGDVRWPGLSTPSRIGCWFHHACPHLAESAVNSTRLVHTWQNQLLIPQGLSTSDRIGCWFHQACTPSPSLLAPTEQKQPLK